jgi:hypothetical protein
MLSKLVHTNSYKKVHAGNESINGPMMAWDDEIGQRTTMQQPTNERLSGVSGSGGGGSLAAKRRRRQGCGGAQRNGGRAVAAARRLRQRRQRGGGAQRDGGRGWTGQRQGRRQSTVQAKRMAQRENGERHCDNQLG